MPAPPSTTNKSATASSTANRSGAAGMAAGKMGSGTGSSAGNGGAKSSTSQAASSNASKSAASSGAKSSTSQAAAKSSSAAKSSTGSGAIGSKGGGASTQAPGAGGNGMSGGGIVSKTALGFNQAKNAITRPTINTPGGQKPSAPKPSVGQGFISRQTQQLQGPQPGMSSPGISRPGVSPAKYSAPVGPKQPTGIVKAGESWTSPKGVSAPVAKALAAMGYNPDGTKMQNGIVANKYASPIGPSAPAKIGTNPNRYAAPAGPYQLSDEGNIPWAKPSVPQNLKVSPGPMPAPNVDPNKYAAPAGPYQLSDEGNIPWAKPSAPQPVRPASVPAPMPMRPGFQYGNPQAPIPELTYSDPSYEAMGSIFGVQPTKPSLQQNIAGDPITFAGPRANTAPPVNFADPQSQNTTLNRQSLEQAVSAMPTTNMGPRAGVQSPIDRAIAGMAAPAGYGMPTFNTNTPAAQSMMDRALSESTINGALNPAPNTPARAPVDNSPVTGITYQGRGVGDAPTSADIAGVGNESVAPAGVQNAYTVQRGDTLGKIAAKNGTTVKAIAEANGIKNPNAIQPGQQLNIPTNASISPMGSPFEIDVGGQGLPVADDTASISPSQAPGLPFRNGVTGNTIPQQYLDRHPLAQTSPSQGENVAPSQLERRPQDVGELYSRYQNEKENLRNGIRSVPGRVAEAILGGQYNNPLGRGNFPGDVSSDRPTQMNNSSAPRQTTGNVDDNAVLQQLLALLSNQQGITSGSPSQMDLVMKTFL